MQKFVQFSVGESSLLRLGMLTNGRWILPINEWPDMRSFLESGVNVAAAGAKVLASAGAGAGDGSQRPTSDCYDMEQCRLGPPVHNPSKVLCIGLNYRDHARETNMAIPSKPVVFNKFPSSLAGPFDTIQLPSFANEIDYEAELVVVIGRRVRAAESDDEAMAAVAGYTVGNDLSARDLQLQGNAGQWLLGKCLDSFAPIGPCMVPAAALDPGALGVSCTVNGRTVQQSNTDQFIFPVPTVVRYLSMHMTLMPGDLIFTGTPPGVALGTKSPDWLKGGDVVTTEIESIGKIENKLVSS